MQLIYNIKTFQHTLRFLIQIDLDHIQGYFDKLIVR